MDSGNVDSLIDPSALVSVKISASRNLDGFSFSPAITRAQRREAEHLLSSALLSLSGNGSESLGKYISFMTASAEDQALLKDVKVNTARRCKHAESAGILRDWPDSRGAFVSTDKAVVAVVNGMDQLNVSVTSTKSLSSAYEQLNGILRGVEASLSTGGSGFLHTDHLGFVTTSPRQLGTALIATVELYLPHVSQRTDLDRLGTNLGVKISPANGNVVVSANSVLGHSEAQQLRHLAHAAAALVGIEHAKA